MTEKKCTKCKIIKPISEFHNGRHTKDGKIARCKSCISVINAAYRDPEYQRLYKLNNKSAMRKYREKTKLKRWEEKGYIIENGKPAKARKMIGELLKKSNCLDCGESNPLVLEFDHIGEKNFEIGTYMSREIFWSKKLEEEIALCEIVCANCHKIRTNQRINSWRITEDFSK